MLLSSQDEAFRAFRSRHLQLLNEPELPAFTPELARLRLLNSLASIQVDLFLRYKDYTPAQLLNQQLISLAAEPLAKEAVLARLRLLLRPTP